MKQLCAILLVVLLIAGAVIGATVYVKIQFDDAMDAVEEVKGEVTAAGEKFAGITDTTIPMFLPGDVAEELPIWEAYTIPTEAYDLFGDVTYSMEIGDQTVAGKTFMPTKAGEMAVTLVATNSAGRSARRTYTFNVVNDAAFVATSENAAAAFGAEGIRLMSSNNGETFFFGTFDATYGIDTKFIVRGTTSSGALNDAQYLSMLLINAEDEAYQMAYRVWLNQSGPDRPTEIYLSTDGGENFTKLGSTGWISCTVDDVADQYHMSFDLTDTFVGERTSGMQRVDNAYDRLIEYLAVCPSTSWRFGMELGRQTGTVGVYEATVTEINGQSLSEPIEWQDVQLAVGMEIPETATVGDKLTLKAYAKDLRGGEELICHVTAPDGSETVQAIPTEGLEITFSAEGVWRIVVVAKGCNGREAMKSYSVAVSAAEAET